MDDLRSRQPAFIAYEKGVPMGGDLRAAPEGAEAPTFMVYALRDPIGANLDRIQIVKGWMDAAGESHEKVFDVAWSEGCEMDANGMLPAVGNTVDIAAATWYNTIGASELALGNSAAERSPWPWPVVLIVRSNKNAQHRPNPVPIKISENAISQPLVK